MYELYEVKAELRRFFEMLDNEGIIKETGQTYRKVRLETIFAEDAKELYNVLANLENMSKE